MFIVTIEAEEKLEESLQEQTADSDVAIRIVANPTNPIEHSLTLDKEKEGDQVIKSEGGRKILLVQSNLALEFERMVFDHHGTPQCSYFTLSDPAPSSKH